MKTYKNLYEKLCSLDNLYLAYQKARKGKTKKHYVIEFEKNIEENLLKLQQELSNKTYSPKPLQKMLIRDPKTRTISKSDFRDRIVHHALVNILESIFEKSFIFDSYASRRGKGQHKALERFNFFKRKVSQNGRKLKGINDNNYVVGYALKIDIKQYFDSIDRRVLLNIISRKVKDKDVIWLARTILYNFQSKQANKGMPLGNYTSQFFANVYLNELDHYVKHNLKAKYYLRYVDDIIILDKIYFSLQLYFSQIKIFLRNSLLLEVHPTKSRVMPLHEGIHLLGFRVFYHYTLLKKQNKKEIIKRIEKWEELNSSNNASYSKDLFLPKLNGWIAHASHGTTYNLRKQVCQRFNKLFP